MGRPSLKDLRNPENKVTVHAGNEPADSLKSVLKSQAVAELSKYGIDARKRHRAAEYFVIMGNGRFRPRKESHPHYRGQWQYNDLIRSLKKYHRKYDASDSRDVHVRRPRSRTHKKHKKHKESKRKRHHHHHHRETSPGLSSSSSYRRTSSPSLSLSLSPRRTWGYKSDHRRPESVSSPRAHGGTHHRTEDRKHGTPWYMTHADDYSVSHVLRITVDSGSTMI